MEKTEYDTLRDEFITLHQGQGGYTQEQMDIWILFRSQDVFRKVLVKLIETLALLVGEEK